ncbi:Cryptochrome-1, partial [Dissostichus eleginoides]
RYLPILKGFPAKYIYDPWNAPEDVQKAAKCIVGVHYPKPMVNHAEASRINIERMKQIYQQLSSYKGLGMLTTIPANPKIGVGGVNTGSSHSVGGFSTYTVTPQTERVQTTQKRRREEGPHRGFKSLKQSK